MLSLILTRASGECFLPVLIARKLALVSALGTSPLVLPAAGAVLNTGSSLSIHHCSLSVRSSRSHVSATWKSKEFSPYFAHARCKYFEWCLLLRNIFRCSLQRLGMSQDCPT